MMSTNRKNGGLAPRRWLRDRQAERDLLDLLDADAEASKLPPAGVPRDASHAGTPAPADQATERAVFSMELLNR